MAEQRTCAACGVELANDVQLDLCVPCAFAKVLADSPLSRGPGQKTELALGQTELIGREIRGYKLLELLGEGGCGIVYLAEQEAPVRRKVAFKIIKPGMDSKQVLARFEAERQALAMMDHPPRSAAKSETREKLITVPCSGTDRRLDGAGASSLDIVFLGLA